MLVVPLGGLVMSSPSAPAAVPSAVVVILISSPSTVVIPAVLRPVEGISLVATATSPAIVGSSGTTSRL